MPSLFFRPGPPYRRTRQREKSSGHPRGIEGYFQIVGEKNDRHNLSSSDMVLCHWRAPVSEGVRSCSLDLRVSVALAPSVAAFRFRRALA